MTTVRVFVKIISIPERDLLSETVLYSPALGKVVVGGG